MQSLPRVCVIGAGCSGIAATKTLTAAGFAVDCFEKSDRVGGLWVFRDDDARHPKTAAYRSLHINTSRKRMEFSDFPMPASLPDFPSHRHIAEYFDAYVDHFGVRNRIHFETEVLRCHRRARDLVWEVTVRHRGGSTETREYGLLVVANGHHWDPRWPEPAFPGRFDGVAMHSHSFVDADSFRGKTVLVLGMGNSAMDIAVESSYLAKRVLLSARRGAHVVPKYLFGRPIDTFGASPWIPFPLRVAALRALVRLSVGRMETYGLPAPDHRLGEAHPTISNDILNRVAHGSVIPKPNIRELAGREVIFADGTREAVDVIVYATGYKVSFPFFDPDFLAAKDNDLPLYRRVFAPHISNLAFIGLLQPLGAIMPLSELQSEWVADLFRGTCALPSRPAMEKQMKRERQTMFARYVPSKRHTMQVDYDDYLRDLRLERRFGAARAILQRSMGRDGSLPHSFHEPSNTATSSRPKSESAMSGTVAVTPPLQ